MSKKNKKSTKALVVLLVAAVAVFAFSGYKVLSEVTQKQKEQDAFEQLAQQVQVDEQRFVVVAKLKQ